MVLGLDMLFLGGKQQKKNKGKSKGNEINRFARSGFAPDFGSRLYGAAEAAPLQNNDFFRQSLTAHALSEWRILVVR
jgi:hypothetical protein